MLVLSFNFFNAGNILLAIGSLAVSVFFIVLMVKNIKAVKKIREEKKNDN
jgi:hypothetical protein